MRVENMLVLSFQLGISKSRSGYIFLDMHNGKGRFIWGSKNRRQSTFFDQVATRFQSDRPTNPEVHGSNCQKLLQYTTLVACLLRLSIYKSKNGMARRKSIFVHTMACYIFNQCSFQRPHQKQLIAFRTHYRLFFAMRSCCLIHNYCGKIGLTSPTKQSLMAFFSSNYWSFFMNCLYFDCFEVVFILKRDKNLLSLVWHGHSDLPLFWLLNAKQKHAKCRSAEFWGPLCLH